MIRVSVTDPATEWEFQRVSSEERDRAGVSPEASVAIVRALANIQDGVFAWSVVVDGLVETSSNLGVVRGDSQHLRVELLSRSSVDEEVLRLQNRMSSAFATAFPAKWLFVTTKASFVSFSMRRAWFARPASSPPE